MSPPALRSAFPSLSGFMIKKLHKGFRNNHLRDVADKIVLNLDAQKVKSTFGGVDKTDFTIKRNIQNSSSTAASNRSGELHNDHGL